MTYGPDQPGGYQGSAYRGLGTPASGQAYPQPTGQSYPGTPPGGQAYPSGQAHPPPAKSGRGGVIALVLALVLAVAGAGTFAALWFVERGEHTTTRDSLARSERKATDTEDALAKSDEAKRVAETKVGELTKCQEAARDLIESLDGGDSQANRDKTTDALDRMDSFC